MILKGMTDRAIAAELGQRLAQIRLEQNRTQAEVAKAIGISRMSYVRLEQGQTKLEVLIAALRYFGRLDLVDGFIPETPFSPIALLKLQGKQRQRASGSHSDTVNEPEDDLDW